MLVRIPRAFSFGLECPVEVEFVSWKKNMLENRIIIREDFIIIMIFCIFSGIETSMDLNHRF